MNKVIISGSLGRDPEVRYTTGENATAVARFSVACQRKFKNKDGQYEVDWPNVICFGKSAEFVEKYFKKGDRIEVVGRITTGSYVNKDGVKVYTTEVTAEDIGFGGGKNSNNSTQASNGSAPVDNSYTNIPDGIDDELPFN